MEVISASRRTDLPAFYADWFMGRVRAGRVAYRNPFCGSRYAVSLRPADVHSIVFWSKDFRPLMPYLDDLASRGFDFYFHFTITGLPPLFEPRVCSTALAVRTFRELASRFAPERVQWRYDPIIVSSARDFFGHLRVFNRLCAELEGHTRRCYLSFARMYGKTRRNLARLGSRATVVVPSIGQQRWLARRLGRIARARGIRVFACAGEHLADGVLVEEARCIDGELLAELFPDKPRVTGTRPTRPGCNCVPSRDIGAYDTCAHGCLYCYATATHDFARGRSFMIDQCSEELGR